MATLEIDRPRRALILQIRAHEATARLQLVRETLEAWPNDMDPQDRHYMEDELRRTLAMLERKKEAA